MHITKYFPQKVRKKPFFLCRVWSICQKLHLFIYFLSSNKAGSKHYKDIKKLIFILSVRLFEE